MSGRVTTAAVVGSEGTCRTDWASLVRAMLLPLLALDDVVGILVELYDMFTGRVSVGPAANYDCCKIVLYIKYCRDVVLRFRLEIS